MSTTYFVTGIHGQYAIPGVYEIGVVCDKQHITLSVRNGEIEARGDRPIVLAPVASNVVKLSVPDGFAWRSAPEPLEMAVVHEELGRLRSLVERIAKAPTKAERYRLADAIAEGR